MKDLNKSSKLFCKPTIIRGATYQDGGVAISEASEEGASLIDEGYTYVCPHGILCRSLETRDQDCPDCK